ncbi:Hypothetical protein R9X50_00783100 [Acrodontium crateriforme]|uniref:Uncharacterized protein n=1 Tax=Acrodontium crateriforme TaxID=150365 RepID=A0AAQ3RB16_9PEZI|nr:Hypothetical protein R9X50_00783100 [Acrodontium crateriforme]
MVVETNGTPTVPKTDTMNEGTAHASGISSRRAHRRKRQSYTAWTVDKGAKLLVWYALVTVVFRCPSNLADISTDSPVVCKAYLQSKDFLSPHAKPYYDQYLAPHIQRVQPYVDQVHTKVYQPGYAVYQQYGAPRVANAQKLGHHHWEKTVKPQLHVARQSASEQFDAVLGPHVRKVCDAVQPYYESVKTSATDIWELEVQPIYRRVVPYAQKATPYAHYAYSRGQQIAVQTVLPQAQYAGSIVWSFWSRQVWPKVRVLYGENVEPQLLRITERLGRYKDGKQLQAEIKSIEAQSSAELLTSSVELLASSLSSTMSGARASPSTISQAVSEATADSTPEPKISPLQQFEQDLNGWEHACTTAVDEGADHLREHITELTKRHARNQVHGTGEALLVQLEETATKAIDSIKARILNIVENIPDDADDERIAAAHDTLVSDIRSSGQAVKKSAQAIREWYQRYNAELDELVDKALESTLETIDDIRELRLTEIGRRYADQGLPHKMWSKYNALKKATKVWRDDLEDVINGNADIKDAKHAAEDLESRAMGITEETAIELARLRDVGKWKATAGDASDEFETKILPATAERARKRVVEKVADASEAILGTAETEPGFVKSAISMVAERASEVSSSASGIVYSVAEAVTSTVTVEEITNHASASIGSGQSSIENAYNNIQKSAASVASAASEAVVGTESGISDRATDAASEASEAISTSETVMPASSSSHIYSIAETPLSKTLEPKAANILAAAKKHREVASKRVSSINSDIYEGVLSATEAAASSMSSAALAVSEAIPDSYDSSSVSAIKKVYGGAMAQIIAEAREPILDEELDDDTDNIAASASSAAGSAAAQVTDAAINIAAKASSHYSDATSQASVYYEKAMSLLSVQVSGTSEPIHKQMYTSIESAYSDSLAAASKRLQEVVGATIAANPPTTSSRGAYQIISSIASSRLAEGISAASAQYQSAKISVGVEPTPVHQQYLAAAQRKYYEGLGIAHDQYSSFLAVASSAVGATPTAGYQAYVAAAQSTYKAALADAKRNMESLLAAAAATAESAPSLAAAATVGAFGEQYDAAVQAAQSQLAAASSQASELFFGSSKGSLEQATDAAVSAYGDAVSAASSAIYGTETPWKEAMVSQASENWEALISQASERVYGAQPAFTDVVVSHADAYAVQVTAFVTGQYEAIEALFSELIVGKEPDFTESVMSRLSSAYATGAADWASSASSYAGDAYASASSAIEAVFTPPAALDTLMDQVNSQLDAAVSAASEQFYGTSKDYFESATDVVASAYSDASSQVSEAVYGTQTGYAEAAQASLFGIGASASKVISEALYGTPTGTIEAAQNSAGSIYSSMASAASAQAAAVSSAVNAALYGEEQTYLEDMQAQIAAAVANAQSRVAEYGGDATKLAADSISQAGEFVADAASSVVSAASAATERVKDEL